MYNLNFLFTELDTELSSTIMPRRNTMTDNCHEQDVVVQTANITEAGLEDNKTFEETVVKVEVYASERALTRALDAYEDNSVEERRLVRKIDAKLLPLLGSMFFFQSLDRTGMVRNTTASRNILTA
jgi:hypothetical protein